MSTLCTSTVPVNEVYCSCASPYINVAAGKKFVGMCNIGNPASPFYVKETVPIKTLLAGTSISPWAKIEFIEPCDSFFVTTGNVSTGFSGTPSSNSRDTCRAVIKSFQYSWGTIGQGNTAKVVIHDEQGSSFKLFMDRLFKNSEGGTLPRHGVYKVKATWGWYVSGWNGCDPGILPDDQQVICSPECWFIPNGIQSSIQNGKFVYELELIDALQRAEQQLIAKSIGEGTDGLYFTEAVEELGRISLPAFRVAFRQVNDDGTESPMKFHLESGTTNTTFDPDKGIKKKTWPTRERDPLKIINNWLTNQLAEGGIQDQGRGITMNYDSTYHCRAYDTDTEPTPPAYDSDTDCYPGPVDEERLDCPPCRDDSLPANGRMILWADPKASFTGSNLSVADKVQALYIVNGGNCSSVLSFSPAIKWNFQAALKAYGSTATNTGYQSKQSVVNLVNASARAIGNACPANQEIQDVLGQKSQIYTQKCVANHHRASYPINSIEAELRVQGDPSMFLCTPLKGFGRTVAIVVINPFYLDSADPILNPDDCLIWTQKPGGSDTTVSSCNEILTSRAWFIKGVDHQIKEGSYVTTIKVFLPTPGGEIADRFNPFNRLGGDEEFGYAFDSIGDAAVGFGTRECIHRYPVGGEAVDSEGCALLDGGSVGYGDYCGATPPCPPDCP
jgi:hypothetical protein